MKKTRFKMVAALVLVLTVLVGLVIAGPGLYGRKPRVGPEFGSEWPGRFGMGMRWPDKPGMWGMLSRLDLTDEQKESVKQITEAAKEKNKTAAEAVGEARKALQEAVVEGDETAIRKAATNLGKVLGDQAVLKFQTRTSIKAVLTPEQLQKLAELKATMKERAEKFREKMDDLRFRESFQGFGWPGDSWGLRGGRHGFGPFGRGPNVVAPTEPWGHGWKRGWLQYDRRPEWDW
jgi:Spy/CpxP family protein refolding chaperone